MRLPKQVRVDHRHLIESEAVPVLSITHRLDSTTRIIVSFHATDARPKSVTGVLK
jgi:hypothetical protein